MFVHGIQVHVAEPERAMQGDARLALCKRAAGSQGCEPAVHKVGGVQAAEATGRLLLRGGSKPPAPSDVELQQIGESIG